MPFLVALNSPIGLFTYCLLPNCLRAFGVEREMCWSTAGQEEFASPYHVRGVGKSRGAVVEEHPLPPLDVIGPRGSARIRADAGASWQLC